MYGAAFEAIIFFPLFFSLPSKTRRQKVTDRDRRKLLNDLSILVAHFIAPFSILSKIKLLFSLSEVALPSTCFSLQLVCVRERSDTQRYFNLQVHVACGVGIE
jgi:hypothetical protein